jgi:hypothetical protein
MKLKKLVNGITMLFTLFTIACDDNSSSGCKTDDDCVRGSVCESGSCQTISCNGLIECSGEGRTCLADLKSCSVKECNDIVRDVQRSCSDPSLVCSTDPFFKYTCVNPATLSCQSDAECAGQKCCLGSCQPTCSIPTQDMMVSTDMMSVVADMNIADMNSMPSSAGLCSPCNSDAQCSATLGAGAKCTAVGSSGGRYCTSACSAPTDCPSNYTCLANVNQCLPAGFQCVACLTTPCPNGTVCNTSTGSCDMPKSLCGSCNDNAGCADGLVCGQVGNAKKCLDSCANGAPCANGSTCANGACVPDSGRCDACLGSCNGATPFCIEATGQCGACGPGTPCPNGETCNNQTYTCSANTGGCVVDADCAGSANGKVCVSGQCVACIQDIDCGPRFKCNTQTFSCEADPCGGVQCQMGSMCNPSVGKCVPGCTTNMDCANPDSMSCNAETGQCYNNDASCDFGATSVCAPGGTCNPNALAMFDPTLPGSCSCAKENPMDIASPDRIPCHPGQTCLDLSAFLPGTPASCTSGF